LKAVAQKMLDGCGIKVDISKYMKEASGNCIGDIMELA
jgi:hypothetical protein